jgi:predicted signal transduction protein with EAL and GGDEF domain
MINRIKTHNILSGIIFSVVEFVITALIIAPFAVYYVVDGRVLYATVAIGIILNCLMIVVFGLQQYKDKEKDVGIQHMLDKSVRERISREYPHLSNETSVLVITLLLPFVLFAWVIGELLFKESQRNERGDIKDE